MLTQGIKRMTTGLRDEFIRARAISQNQANLDTPGFRQTLSGVRQGKMSRWRDDSVGAFKETGRGLDIAPSPGEFFEIERGGELHLTTRGDLKMDLEGYLTVGSGERILGDDGKSIKLDSLQQTTISEDGGVYSRGRQIANIRRVKVSEVRELGGTIYRPTEEAKVEESTAPIAVGTLHGSNADLTRNQTDLIATIHRARIFSQAATLQDATVERAIRGFLGN